MGDDLQEGHTVDEGINDYMDHHTVDCLVVFPKKEGLFRFHKSLSTQIVLHCPVPVTIA
jgi:nucleotide-binding universal stress UspA family protein